jgi:hypothetical protein
MGNTTGKVFPKMSFIPTLRKNKVRAQQHNVPPPLSQNDMWKNNMIEFMKTHIMQLQNYSDNELQFVKERVRKFNDGYGYPFRSFTDEKFSNAVDEITELMKDIGNWHSMQQRASTLITWYIQQQRQTDLEEIAFVFCVLVIEPQVIRMETRWCWDAI